MKGLLLANHCILNTSTWRTSNPSSQSSNQRPPLPQAVMLPLSSSRRRSRRPLWLMRLPKRRLQRQRNCRQQRQAAGRPPWTLLTPLRLLPLWPPS